MEEIKKHTGYHRVPFMFTFVDTLNQSETLRIIEDRIRARETTQHVVINAGKICLMRKDKVLCDIVNNCPIINADGQSIVWASHFLGHRLPERVAGVDLMEKLIELAAGKGFSVYFFGATEDVVVRVKEFYEKKYPALKVAGYRNGYFKPEDDEEIIKNMLESKADILFVGFSSPKKEYWIRDHIDKVNIPFMMGVGGSFDTVIGHVKRAPMWMQKIGMEWFYRFIKEPRRMFRRYMIGNFQFIGMVLKHKFSGKQGGV